MMITQISAKGGSASSGKYRLQRLLFFILIFFTINLYAQNRNLYEIFKNAPEIKIYLRQVINNVDNEEVQIDIFKEVFKKSLENRKNIRFRYVKDRNEADIVVDSTIKKYVFTEKAMPLIYSIWSITADVTRPKSSGRLTVDYVIKDPFNEKVIFTYKNFTTDARKPRGQMKGKLGFINAVNKNVDRFLFRVFYKPR